MKTISEQRVLALLVQHEPHDEEQGYTPWDDVPECRILAQRGLLQMRDALDCYMLTETGRKMLADYRQRRARERAGGK